MAVDGRFDNIELQEVDNIIYESIEDTTGPTAQEKDLRKKLQSVNRRHKWIEVGVGLLCAVLAVLSVALPLYLYQTNMVEREQLVNSNKQLLQDRCNDVTEERDQLLDSNNKLTEEKDQLLNRYNNVTEEKDQLLVRYNKVTEEKDQLLDRYNKVTEERDDLKKWLCGQPDDMKRKLCESDGFTFGDGLCYYISTGKSTWMGSSQWCKERQSDLMVIKSKEKQDFVEGVNKTVWLGLTRKEGSFKWVDGTSLSTPTYWLPDTPHAYLGDCVEFVAKGLAPDTRGWNVRYCTIASNLWICERVLC